MRILVVQLSDMHCESTDSSYTQKIRKATDALKPLGKMDGAALVFSGDLANRCQKNEYSVGRRMLGIFVSRMSEIFNCGNIPTLIVPGNHDMLLPDGCREIKDILAWDRKGHLDEELDRSENFYEYSRSKGCFVKDRLCDVQTVPVGPANIQFCLLNSAPYSTREKDNKEVHFFPAYVGEKMARDASANLKITVMHHSYAWCDWETQQMLKKCFAEDDLVFMGHDHLAETLTILNANGDNMNIIMGGEFTLKSGAECAFNAIVYDDETNQIERYEYVWHTDGQLFTQVNRGSIATYQQRKSLAPTEDFLDKLLVDKQQLSSRFTDYYVLPKLIAEGETFSENPVERINVDSIFSALEKDRVIGITGGNGSGKSSLLKYLYYSSIERGYLPLFVEKKGHDSRFEKMFRDLFESQYGNVPYGYDKYMQCDFEKRIIFVDDLDLIHNQKARENLFAYIVSYGGLLIYSTKDKLQQNLTEAVKERLQGKLISNLEIRPFYKETRDELVKRICSLEQYAGQDPQAIIAALDYMVQCQANLFTLTPGNLAQYIKYFLSGKNIEEKGNRTITLVFETNIRNSILECVKDTDANIVLAALEFVAYNMYFELRCETLSLTNLEGIVHKFNTKRRANLNAKNFLSTCIRAKILVEVEDSFDVAFNNKNTYAYFVAKYVNREIERNPANQTDITYIMNHICFGINDTIVLFLSYIRSNSRIILNIAVKAADLLENYPELDFDQNNLPFIKRIEVTASTVPTEKEKKKSTQVTEKVEMARHEAVKFRGIFDYDERDVEKDKYRILRALKYTQLIGRTLVDQYGDLEDDELDVMVKCLYSLPQRILYAVLKPYQEHYEDTIADLMRFVKEKLPDEKITEDDIRKMLGEAAVTLALNLMNDIAYNATSTSTVSVLNEIDILNSNYALQNLMMVENAGVTSDFVEKALAMNTSYRKDPFIRTLVMLVARKHIIHTPHIDHRHVDKLISGKVLLPDGKKTLLIEQQKIEKS